MLSKVKYIFIILFLLCAHTVNATTYYVDGTCGDCAGTYSPTERDCAGGHGDSSYTAYDKWADLNSIVDSGDTVYIRGGTTTYEEYNIGSGEGIVPTNSGTSIAPITIAVYPGEMVHWLGDADDSYRIAIDLNPNDWIRIIGYDGSTTARNWKFSNFSRFLQIWDGDTPYPYADGGDYNEIAYCEFTQVNDWSITYTIAATNRILHNSDYNWIHHCTFSKMGAQTGDIGACLAFVWTDCGGNAGENDVCSDDTTNNVIEDCEFWGGGHEAAELNAHKLVFRNNYVHNEQWYQNPNDDLWYSHRNVQIANEYNTGDTIGFCLIEGNMLSHSSNNYPQSGLGGVGMHLGVPDYIVRYNDFYANAGQGMYLENHSEGPGGDGTGTVNNNHVYNNTFSVNGFGCYFVGGDYDLDPSTTNDCGEENCPTRGDNTDRIPVYFVTGDLSQNAEYIWQNTMIGNVFKNNLFYNNRNSETGKEPIISGMWNSGYDFDDCGGFGQSVCGNTIFAGNMDDDDFASNPFVSMGDYGSPSIMATDYEWYWSGNTASLGTNVRDTLTDPDFTLTSGSEAIDSGVSLTWTTNDGSSSTTLVVDDAQYFQDGWGNGAGGGAVVYADTIAIGSVSNTVLISSIDYSGNTITLSEAKTWSSGDVVYLAKDSTNTQVLYGTAPDVGAHESGSALGNATISANWNEDDIVSGVTLTVTLTGVELVDDISGVTLAALFAGFVSDYSYASGVSNTVFANFVDGDFVWVSATEFHVWMQDNNYDIDAQDNFYIIVPSICLKDYDSDITTNYGYIGYIEDTPAAQATGCGQSGLISGTGNTKVIGGTSDTKFQ